MKKLYFFPLIILFISCTSEMKNEVNIHVDAGDYDRFNSVISFTVPDTLQHEAYHLIDSGGNRIPLQIEDQKAYFVLSVLNAGESITFRMVPSEEQENNPGGVSYQHLEDAVGFFVNGDKPVLHYRSGAGGVDMGELDDHFKRGGYLHPVYNPNGEEITAHYHPDRPHQNGIWSGWSRTQFDGRSPSFWTPASGAGLIEAHSLDKTWSGPVHGGLRATHHFIDKTGDRDVTILSENWTVRVHNILEREEQPIYLFDLDSEQENITEHPFTIHEHVYGGISFRGNDSWLGEENSRLLTSEGKTRVDGAPIRDVWSHIEAHQSRAKWAYLSGVVDGEHPGIVILVHPENLEFPEPIFMNLREPFFAFSPAAMGDITIEPGESLRFQYRYVLLNSDPGAEFIENLWLDYAYPAKVTLN
ncbi:MAG: PmoA family protein [Balneolaceae bacterium]|nr:PmoA family protein [Balneolaceae bacterium]